MISRNTRLLIMLLLLVVIGCSSGGDTPVTPPQPDSPGEFTTRGWQFFEGDHFSDALDDFNAALALLPSHGEALAGKGWCNLKLSVGASGLSAAASSFEAALNSDEDESYVLAGLACVRLAQGGASLVQASSLASTVVSTDPSFVFSHQPTINATDMILISAFAKAVAGEFSSALQQADLIEDSGIQEDDLTTWLVAGTTFSSYSAAVLARLHQLSEQYSG